MFDLDGAVAFINDGDIFVFDEELDMDMGLDDSATPITAVYTANHSDLEVSGNKILRAVSISAELFGDKLKFEFNTPNSQKEYTIFPKENEEYSALTVRCATERFKYASFSIISDSSERQKIHSLTLHLR